MKLQVIDADFTVSKVKDYSQTKVDAPFCFTGRTDEERSLVCRTEDVPANTSERDDGWKGFRIEGVLDFSLIGILSKLTGLLAGHGIGIFAISTYNTDYVLTKDGQFEQALAVLEDAGYEIQRP